jgi:hypothetical protein
VSWAVAVLKVNTCCSTVLHTNNDNRTTIRKHLKEYSLRSTEHNLHCVPALLQINEYYKILKIFSIIFSPAKIQQKGKITLLTPWPKLMGPILREPLLQMIVNSTLSLSK